MTRVEFRRVIRKALEDLPPIFQEAMENIDIQVRWRATVHELRQAGVRHGDTLFGVYTGIALPKRGHGYSMVAPDTIVIYQQPHEACCRNEPEMVEQAKKTLLHEIGHYMGIDENRLYDLGMS